MSIKKIHLGKPEDMIMDEWFSKTIEREFDKDKISSLIELIHELGHSTYITEHTTRANIYSIILQELFERKIKIIDLLMLSVDMMGAIAFHHHENMEGLIAPLKKILDDLIKREFGEE